ncbi:hypothetical protein AX16_004366 [Volvariella volvacea WC 439]|nr:hypothetical protein AX16_004366 [Volvariella volvacea WC 439]
MWALRRQIRFLEGLCQKKQTLQLNGEFIDPRSPENSLRSLMMFKLARFLMLPKIGKHVEAIRYIKQFIETLENRYAAENSSVKLWIENPFIFKTYGEALLYDDLAEAKTALEKALEGFQGPETRSSESIPRAFETRISLILALKELGIERRIRKEHESWAITFLKRNTDAFSDERLREILIKPKFGVHPVLAKLGGEKWFEMRKLMTPRFCRQCGGREPDVQLFCCGSCLIAWYCSKKCQVENWKTHKCMVKERKEVEMRREQSPGRAIFDTDWINWFKCFCDRAPIHALGLHRDPTRGKTHIMICHVLHSPTAQDLRDKFTIVAVNVYKVDEVLPILEEELDFDRGKGQEHVNDLLEKFERIGGEDSDKVIPAMCLVANVERGNRRTWFGCAPIPKNLVEGLPYDPNWRKILNCDNPPGNILWLDGPIDREHTF